MQRTPEVQQVVDIVRQVVRQHFGGDKWVPVGDPLMKAIEAAVDKAQPGARGAA